MMLSKMQFWAVLIEALLKELESKLYRERLGGLGMLSLEKRRVRKI